MTQVLHPLLKSLRELAKVYIHIPFQALFAHYQHEHAYLQILALHMNHEHQFHNLLFPDDALH